MNTAESARYATTEMLIDAAREQSAGIVLGAPNQEGFSSLSDLIATTTIATIEDGVVHVPKNATNSNAIPVILMYPGESLTLGDGFDEQTPRQIERARAIVEKWGVSKEVAGRILANMATTVVANYSRTPTITMREQANGATITASCLFLPEDVLHDQDLEKPISARAIQASGRPLIAIGNTSGPEILGHEIVHANNKIETPVRTITSQRALDMRGLREELKAYQAGAAMIMSGEGKSTIVQYDLERILEDTQLLVEFVRAAVNARDSDPYRTTPELTSQLAGAGIPYEHLVHNRINVAKMLAHLQATSPPAHL